MTLLQNNGRLTKNMVEITAGNGPTYEGSKKLYIKYGKEGLMAILSKLPCGSMSSSPRVTRTKRILSGVIQHFRHNIFRYAVNNFVTLMTHLTFCDHNCK